MAIRKIMYTVSVLGVEPSAKQFCGVQGDHNIYSLEFNIEAELWNKLQSEAAGGTLYYHFDLYNGEGATASTDILTLESSTVTTDVGEWLTRYGGVGKAVLVITASKDNATHSELYSFPALLQFKSRPTGSEPDGEEYQSMTTLFQKAKQAAYDAEAARLQAQAASDSANDVRTALDKGMVLKLDGQRADGIAEIFDTVSSEVTETGENAVSGAAVFNTIKPLIEKMSNLEEQLSKAKLEAHPVGSLYWSSNSDNPSGIFGGTWKPIEDKFILAASQNKPVGSIGGKETFELNSNNLPKHAHKGLYYNSHKGINLKKSDSEIEGIGLEAVLNTNIYPSINIGTGENNSVEKTDIETMPPYIAYYCWIRIK